MKIKLLSTIILIFVSIITFGQTKSLRELLLESDVVAVTEKIPDPFFPEEKFIAFSDYEKMTVVDSVKIISYLKKGKKGKKLFDKY